MSRVTRFLLGYLSVSTVYNGVLIVGDYNVMTDLDTSDAVTYPGHTF